MRTRRKPLVCLATALGMLSAPPSVSGQESSQRRDLPAVSAAAAQVQAGAGRLDHAIIGELHPVLRRKISLDLRGVPVEEAIKTVAAAADVQVAFSADIVALDESVTLEARDAELGSVMRQVLRGQAVDLWVSQSGVLVIAPGPEPLQVNPAVREPRTAVQATVTGRVRDAATQQPLAGAAVTVVGTGRGSLTDDQGRFVVSGVPAGEHRVRAALIGYAAQERSVTLTEGASVSIDFALSAEAVVLEGIVAVGYGTQERRDLTGAITSVQGEELSSVSTPTVSAALQGKAAGLTVVSSGVPGSDATFRIRGTSTIGNSNPLVVINGVPTTSGLNQINPRDIESVEVLKDASATAIYGARGANGVVIITTRSGSADGGGLEIGGYTGYQQVAQMVDMLGAAEFARLHNEMMENAGRPQNPDFSDPAALGSGTDWLGALIDVAPIQSYTASYSGGGAGSRFYVSGNVLRQDGVVRNTGFERFSLQLNGETAVNAWLRFGNNVTLNHDVNRSGSYNIQAAMGAQPGQPIFNDDGSYSGPVGRSEWVGDIVNPIGQATLIDNSTLGYNLIGSVFGDLRFSDHLSVRTTLGLQANFWNSRTWSPEYEWQPSPQEESYLFEQYNRSTTWLVDNFLTYRRRFVGMHDVTLMAGTSAQANDFAFMNGSVQGFPSNRAQQLINGIQPPTLNGNESDWGLLSFLGRVNYSYADTYLLTATLRRDGSSRFGKGNKWGLFPSVSAAWRLSNEAFLRDSGLFDDLKLRAGYGVTGNQEIGNYSFASALQTIQYNFGDYLVSGVVPSIMPNPNVHWESVEQFNLGLDASVLDGSVYLALDGYVKNTTGMLVPMSVPVTTGYSDIVTPYINAGKMQNRGIEATLTTDNARGRLNWTTDFNVAYNRNEILSLNDTIPLPAGSIGFNYTIARLQAGRPVNAFYGYVTNGIFQTQEEVDAYAVQVPGSDPYNRTSPGDVRFVDLNNDGIINDEDRTFLGDPNPDFVFGMNNRVSYGNVDLSVFVHGVAGNEIFNANRIWTEGMSSARNQSAAVERRWTGPGTSSTMPRAVFGDPNGNARASDRYIEDGSYVRLRTVTLGYSLPQSLTQRINSTRARVYATGQNLWTITGYSGFDPEVGINGIDNNVYPVTRTISVGFDLGF